MRPDRAQPSLHDQNGRGGWGPPPFPLPNPPAMSSGGQSPPTLDAIITAERARVRRWGAFNRWVTQRQRSVQSRAAEGLNLAGRFWRPARSQIAAQEPRIVFSDNHLQSVREADMLRRRRPGRACSRLESNQHLLRFRQAPSPDRLREQNRGRRPKMVIARPRASSTIWLSKIIPGRRRGCCRGS